MSRARRLGDGANTPGRVDQRLPNLDNGVSGSSHRYYTEDWTKALKLVEEDTGSPVDNRGRIGESRGRCDLEQDSQDISED